MIDIQKHFLKRPLYKLMSMAIAVSFSCMVASAATTTTGTKQTAQMKTSDGKIAKSNSSLPMVGEDVTIIVKGVAIPFTSFGIVHRLRTVPGVTRVQFNLKQGQAVLTLAPNAHVTNQMLRAAVENASYTPGRITWVSTKVQQEHDVAQNAATK